MGTESILSIILPIVYIVVGAGLIWFVVELALTVRKARTTVGEVQEQLEPTLANGKKMTDDIAPVTARVDPLVDRVALTVDAANLEIMRVDQILEDVSQVTGSVTKTMDAVGTITNAPLDLVNSVTDKVRSKMKKRDASTVSVDLGSPQAEEPGTVRGVVDATADIASEAMSEQREKMAQRKADRAERRAQAQEATDKMNATAATLSDAILTTADDDAAVAEASVPTTK